MSGGTSLDRCARRARTAWVTECLAPVGLLSWLGPLEREDLEVGNGGHAHDDLTFVAGDVDRSAIA
jgi:hypothetical protein